MTMKKIILGAFFVITIGSTANAQIKVIGDDYIDSLTATKEYYNRDIDFEDVFPSVLPKDKSCLLEPFYNEKLMNINLTGDTLLLLQPHKLRNQEFATNSQARAISTSEIPVGYYVISGYVFCIENENSVREAAGLSPYNYGYNFTKGQHPNDKNIREFKKEILLRNRDNKVFVDRYLRYIILTSIDTDNKQVPSMNYYCYPLYTGTPFQMNQNIYLRFYNEARKFIGSNMVYGSITYDSLRIVKDVLVDDITSDPIKLNDNSFIVKDVVMKESSLYLILQGEKTGSFAQKIDKIVYGDDKNDFMTTPYGREKGLKKWDIAGFLMEWDRNIYWLAKKDVETLYQRPKIAQAQRERNRQIMNQKTKKREKEQHDLFRQKMISKYGNEKGILVSNHQIAIEMTTEMVSDAWGHPLNSYRTTTKYGQSEVWCYNYKTRVYFYNGKVVRIDE